MKMLFTIQQNTKRDFKFSRRRVDQFTRQYNPEDSSEQNTKIFYIVREQHWNITDIFEIRDSHDGE
jgi:hypothetical protein